MDGFMSEDFLTLPLVLDPTEFQTVGLVNTFQLELSKEQAVPLVILDNGDLTADCPMILPTATLTSETSSSHEMICDTVQLEAHSMEEDDHNLDNNTTTSSSDGNTSVEDLNDLIEKVVTYKCKLCSFKSSEKDSLSSHLKLVHFKNLKPNMDSTKEVNKKDEVPEKTAYLCGKCSEAFGSFADWKRHLSSVHKVVMNLQTILENSTLNGGPPVSLTKPQPPAPQKPEKSKKVVIIPKKDKKIACTIRSCLVRLSSRDLVEKHKECHAGPRRFACPQCSQEFRRWCDCANHLWTAHSVDIDLFSCSACEYKTALKTKFENHIKIHSDEREYMCSECGKTFKQAAQLKNHHVFHLKAIGSQNIPNWSKKQECSQCKRTFYDGKSLKKHIQSVHSNLRPYVCQVCGHTSANKNRLVLHLRQHTGEKPFSCPLCDFTTGDQNCLRRHAWRHSRVRPYSCPHCTYSCIQSNSLKNHIRSQHPGSPGVLSCPFRCPFTSLSQSALDSHTAKVHSSNKKDDEQSPDATFIGDKNTGTSKGLSDSRETTESALDDESQNCFEVPLDTGGITIPAD